ncbi:MAG TPA: sigma-70 family RNA polymerase sigma factor [Parvularculaceae bacterium]|nr:sigma-70 family RNA polymerase sigma factor [Parvularculaceae bacterium]HRX39106.1 sigma-70 family RNA polymerase sigma factor [Parvularculaceae bacterium]
MPSGKPPNRATRTVPLGIGAGSALTDRDDQNNGRKEGRGSAVAAAFGQYRTVLRKLIERRLNRRSDAEDVLQETFALVFEAEKKQRIDHPKSYLYRTAANLVARENSRVSNKLVRYMDDFEDCDLSSNEPSAFDHVAGKQELEAFRRAIATLSPQCQKVFILRKVHGLSHQEIADRLGLSVSTTSKHLAKALERCDAYMRALNEANAGGRKERAKKSNG